MKARIGKVLYALLFVAGLPAMLVIWAGSTESLVPLPRVHMVAPGLILAGFGVGLALAGMRALFVHGGGLPMNAFPPPRYVTRGPYALFEHPIYVGFCVGELGVAIAAGSASGLWLVFPMTCLGCAALVGGYEAHDLALRFGARRPPPWLSIPNASDEPPTLGHRLAFYVRVLLPWAALGAAVSRIGAPLTLPTHRGVAAVLASVLIAVLAAPLRAKSRLTLRILSVEGLTALALVAAAGVACGPWTFCAFYALWASIVARTFGGRWTWVWLGLVCASGVAAGLMGGVLLGLALSLVVAQTGALWNSLRRLSERIANSWREWQFGPIRVIGHGAYAALGTFVALVLIGTLAGTTSTLTLLAISGCTLMGAGAWAQWIEGASGLSRPYGFYGGVAGAIVGCLASGQFGQKPWVLLAATCVSGPWVQSIGRLRCLVQGCCHGSPSSSAVGIRYTHPRSRVRKVPSLVGVPIHPTPLYSILWNVVIALVAGRLWFAHAHLHLLAGVYLALTGIGRFVEESYRGEPQTPVFAGLRLYQWVAVGTALAGIAVTAIKTSAVAPVPQLDLRIIPPALLLALGNFVALGVDFPRGRWPLSRLA